MAAAQTITSCRSAFKQLEILPLSVPVHTVINEIHYQ